MAKFVFKLQTILILKEKLEKRAQLEFGIVMAELEREKRESEKLLNLYENCVGQFSDKARSGVKPEEAIRYNGYLDFMKDKIDKQNVKVALAEEKVEAKRRALAEAAKEHKALEKLRENEFANYSIEERRTEQRTIDEQVSYRFGRG